MADSSGSLREGRAIGVIAMTASEAGGGTRLTIHISHVR